MACICIPNQMFDSIRISVLRNITKIWNKIIHIKDAKNINFYKNNAKQSHIAQNVTETWQKYFQSFIAIEILPQNFCQLFRNISLQHYNFNFMKYFCK